MSLTLCSHKMRWLLFLKTNQILKFCLYAFLLTSFLKVSKTWKQIVKSWILPKNEQMNSFLLVCDVFLFFVFFLRKWRHQKGISKSSDLYISIYFWMAFKSLITLLFYFPIYFPIIDTMCSFFCHLTSLISTSLNQTSVSWIVEFLQN